MAFGGLRYWEIYASTKRLASTADSLVMGGRVATPTGVTPLDYQRSYAFHADSIEITVDLTNKDTASFAPQRLLENIPVPTCEGNCSSPRNMKLNGSMVYAPDGTRFDGEKTVDHFQIRDAFHGFEVWLDRPRRVLVNPRGMYTSRYGFETRLGWVQIGFDTPMAASATQKLRYTLRLVVCIYRLVVC